MAQSHLPSDPFEAHALVVQRAEQEFEQRREQRRKPLPDQAQAIVRLVRSAGVQRVVAEILDESRSGMRLAAFVDHPLRQGDRCEILVQEAQLSGGRWATVRWVEPHPLIQVFGVQFDAV